MIPLESAQFPVFAATDPGMVGKNNEDNFAVSAYQVSESDPTPSIVAIIADGVGGHQAGEVASRYSVDAVIYHYYESPWLSVHENLDHAYRAVNREVYEKQLSDPMYQGMGATLTIADEKLAYVLADRGTYLAFGRKIDLQVLVAGDLSGVLHVVEEDLEDVTGFIVAEGGQHQDCVQ